MSEPWVSVTLTQGGVSAVYPLLGRFAWRRLDGVLICGAAIYGPLGAPGSRWWVVRDMATGRRTVAEWVAA